MAFPHRVFTGYMSDANYEEKLAEFRETPLSSMAPSIIKLPRKPSGITTPGPGYYTTTYGDIGKKKLPSKYGSYAFASNTLRFPPVVLEDTPEVGTYNIDVVKPVKQSVVPFGRKNKFIQDSKTKVPSVGTYNSHLSRVGMEVSTAFGAKHEYVAAVKTICSPQNTAICFKCLQQPIGDYFRNSKLKQDMCRRCMKDELIALAKCSLSRIQRYRRQFELQEFERTRHCSYYHDHFGTNVSVRKRSAQELRFKANIENYLYSFRRLISGIDDVRKSKKAKDEISARHSIMK